MIEQIPLSVNFNYRVVVGPADVSVLLHNLAYEFVGTHRVVGHTVGEALALSLYPGEAEVVFAVGLEEVRALAHSFRNGVDPYGGSVQLKHIVFQLADRKSAACPYEIGLAVIVDEAAGVDAEGSLDGSLLRDERAVRSVGDCDSDAAVRPLAVYALTRGGEVEVILAVLVVAVRSPHLEGVGLYPRNLILGDDPAVVYPVDEVVRRKDVVVFHTEPVFAGVIDRCGNVV